MIRLRIKETGTELGSITEEDLQFLIDNLEEEWEEDQDYYLNRQTLEMLKGREHLCLPRPDARRCDGRPRRCRGGMVAGLRLIGPALLDHTAGLT